MVSKTFPNWLHCQGHISLKNFHSLSKCDGNNMKFVVLIKFLAVRWPYIFPVLQPHPFHDMYNIFKAIKSLYNFDSTHKNNPAHKSHNASDKYPVMHHCCNRHVHTCAHFCYKMVHCGICDQCIVGFVHNFVSEMGPWSLIKLGYIKAAVWSKFMYIRASMVLSWMNDCHLITVTIINPLEHHSVYRDKIIHL